MKTIIYFVIFIVLAGHSVKSQEIKTMDNPNLDQIPFYILQNLPVNTDAPLSSVLTIDNWDNFNLGIDFAENNMSEHPSQPTWFFTAYNTNGTHHTENGHDWYINNPAFGTSVAGDPVSAYDSLGNLFYENMYPSGSIQGCKVVKSTNNGASWDPAVTAISGVDKNWIATDQTAGPYANYVYSTMTKNNGGNFTRSTDNGLSFQSTFTPSTQTLPGMMVCVGPNGNTQGGAVYVVTNGGSTFSSVYTFYQSTDGGATFTQKSSQNFAGYVGTNVGNRHSVNNMRTRPYPFIAADNSYGPNRGRLYCVYATNDPPGNNNKPDVWLRYSSDGGSTWSSAKRVNDDANPTQNNQWHPAIWCDKTTGRLYIQWMDTRDTPTSDSALIYATYTDDGGATFAPNQQISNKKMKIDCPTCGGGGTPRYQGDYNGIVSNGKVAMAGWADFRNGNFLSATAYFPDFALSIDRDKDTLYTASDSVIFIIGVPGVKLYTDTVLLSAIVNPTPTAGTITFSFPSGNTMTTYPNSLPARVVLAGEVPLGNYQVVFTAAGPNGTPVHKRAAMIKVMQGNTFTVTPSADPDTICQGQSSQLDVIVNGGNEPYDYAWTPETGLSDPSIANPIATPMSTTIYHILVTDANSNTAEANATITVNNTPDTPGPISGNQEACKDSITVYSIDEVIGTTSYSWTVPENAVILSGQNTTSIVVQWGLTSGIVSVIAGNVCGNSNPSVLSVAVSSVPDIPGPITGPDIACESLTFDLVIASVPGATGYIWEVPQDVTINSGQGTTTVNITWGTSTGPVSVIAENLCGQSQAQTKTITFGTLPGPAESITGPDSVCQNHGGYIFSTPVINNTTTYEWSLPTGGEITEGQETREITVYFNTTAQTGMISVRGVNDCGSGDGYTKEIVVNPCSGIQEHGLLSTVNIYPNPVKGKLNISISGNEKELEIMVSDAKGQTRYRNELKNLIASTLLELDVTTFQNGIYFIRISNGTRLFTQKFIVSDR